MDKLHTIFKAEYNETDKKIIITFGSNFIPALCHALKLLEIEIERQMVEENIKQAIKNQPIIKTVEAGFKL